MTSPTLCSCLAKTGDPHKPRSRPSINARYFMFSFLEWPDATRVGPHLSSHLKKKLPELSFKQSFESSAVLRKIEEVFGVAVFTGCGVPSEHRIDVARGRVVAPATSPTP